jgi:hypothetical protein
MVDPDIKQAIEIIDRKILSLQQARDQLARAFGFQSIPNQLGIQFSERPEPILASAIPPASRQTSTPRKEALADFLIEHGPMSRVDIVAKAGIPEGTVSYCLADKRFFAQLDDGSWDVTEFSRRGRQGATRESFVGH